MNELEKIAYAKSFIDKLANGINPLDDTRIPDGDIANNVRLSRCFFYVSGLLQKEIEREKKKMYRAERSARAPFFLTPEQREKYEFDPFPISASVLARKIRELTDDVKEHKMKGFSYRKINQFLLNLGMIEWREWENGKMRRFPTADGEAIGLDMYIWEDYGRRSPIIRFSEDAQRFILDNLDAVIATEIKKRNTSEVASDDFDESDD